MKKIFLGLAFLLLSFEVPQAQYINPPSELEAEPEDPLYIKVKWHDESNNEDGFYVERASKLDSADWEVVGGVSQNQRMFFDYWVTHGRKYYYRAYAYNSKTTSGYSNIDSCIAIGDTSNLPARPTNLRVTGTTTTSISVLWDDNANNEFGFIIARKKQGQLKYDYIDTVATDVLTYQDVGLTPDNTYYYKVCSYNGVGISDYSNTVSGTTIENTGIVVNTQLIPSGFYINNNYPNPFNPVTNIKFGLPSHSNVKIVIFNSQGQEIETLINTSLHAGTYTVSWNAEKYSSGAYFYAITANGFSKTNKMILLK